MVGQLTVCLFGNPSLQVEGEPVTGFVSNKAVALVYYLAATGRSHGRDVLANLLWGDFSESKAKKNLRDALSNLRKVMGDYLIITRQKVELNWNVPHVIDVEMLAAASGYEQGVDDVLEDAAVKQLREAVDLYIGPFLDGFYPSQAQEYEEWMQSERERYSQMVVQYLYRLSRHFSQQGDYPLAIEYTSRLLALEPWREEAHQQMMRLLAWSGQRTAALNQYEVCYRALEDELGVTPQVETTALYEQIMTGEISSQQPEIVPPSIGSSVKPWLRHNLPTQLTPFVGRERELAELMSALKQPNTRLLTCLGPGGVGKTRLALQAATRLLPEMEAGETFADGIYFIPMAAVETTDLQSAFNPLVSTIADSLQLSFSASGDLIKQLQNYLREKCLLLIVDNFEHLLSATTFLTDLLQAAPNLKLLITSRSRLNARGEWIKTLSGLEFPSMLTSDRQGWQSYGAVQLFLQTAHTIDPDFVLREKDETAVIRICHLVEGLPLGVELAATWVRVLSIHDIADEIEKNIGFLASSLRDVPERHRSLRAVFDYSWNLLASDEKQVLSQLSVFRSSFERQAAMEVAGASLSLLAALVDSSLVRRLVPEQGQVRYELLEVLRQYAAHKLAENGYEEQQARHRHCQYYLTLLADYQPALQGAKQREALQAIGMEIENVRAAWRWATAQKNMAMIEGAMTSLFHFYDMRSWFLEGEGVFRHTAEMGQVAVASDSTDENRLVWGKLLARQGWFTFYLGRQRKAGQLLTESLQVLRSLSQPTALPFSLNYLAAVEYNLGHYELAQQLCRESLSLTQQLGDRYGEAIGYNISGQIAYRLGKYEAAREFSQQSLTIEQQIGNRWSMGFSVANLGNVAYALGDFDEAKSLFQQGLTIAEEIGDPRGIARCLNRLAKSAMALNRYDEAQTLYQRSLAHNQGIGDQLGVTISLSGLGEVACYQEQWRKAKAYFDDALQRAMASHAIPRVIDILQQEASLMAELGDGSWMERVNRLVDDSQTPYDSLKRLVEQILETNAPSQTTMP